MKLRFFGMAVFVLVLVLVWTGNQPYLKHRGVEGAASRLHDQSEIGQNALRFLPVVFNEGDRVDGPLATAMPTGTAVSTAPGTATGTVPPVPPSVTPSATATEASGTVPTRTPVATATEQGGTIPTRTPSPTLEIVSEPPVPDWWPGGVGYPAPEPTATLEPLPTRPVIDDYVPVRP